MGLFPRLSLVLGLLAWPLVAAGQSTPPASHVVVLMDASGSMTDQRLRDGQLNWSLARQHSAALLREIAKQTGTPFALVHFGANQPSFGVCTEGIGQPMGPATAQSAERAIRTIGREWNPNGKTSLADGIILAWKQLEDTGGMIILFTDFEEDNCGGDPCATVERLFRSRSASKPPIRIRYVIPIGEQGFRTSEAFANCSGAETLPALAEEDIPENVETILESLRTPKLSQLTVTMTALDPTSLGVSLPARSVATVASGGATTSTQDRASTQSVTGDTSRVDVFVPLSDGFAVPSVRTPKGRTSQVATFFTPPLVNLRLGGNIGSDTTKWALKHAQSGREYLFEGPEVLQYLPAGDYDVQVWEGEVYRSTKFTANWNTIVDRSVAR